MRELKFKHDKYVEDVNKIALQNIEKIFPDGQSWGHEYVALFPYKETNEPGILYIDRYNARWCAFKYDCEREDGYGVSSLFGFVTEQDEVEAAQWIEGDLIEILGKAEEEPDED